jgi:hypothetical protein
MTPLEDPTSAAVLASPGGPLSPCEEALCDECEEEIEATRYHCIAGSTCCDVCALRLASQTLDSAADRLTSDEWQALDVVRQISREINAGIWERKGTR